jgi:AcrR family transcriptional regulator
MVAAQPRDISQERAEVTREKLLAAAIRCFTTIGYDAASTRVIEADAGVKRGLIAYHFKTKDVLWKAAVHWLFTRTGAEFLLAERNAADVDADIGARLRYFIRALVRFSARHPEVNRLMVKEGIHGDWRMDWLVTHYVRPLYARAEALFAQARAAGIAPAMDFPSFYYIAIGGSALLFTMAAEARHLAGVDVNDEAVINHHADALARLLFPGGPS